MIGELWAITNTRAKGKNGGIMKKGKIQIYKDKGGGYGTFTGRLIPL